MENTILVPDSIIELKKPHPCGCRLFTVLRVGSDVRIKCNGCGRDMTLERQKVERSVKRISCPQKNQSDMIKEEKAK